MSDTVLFTFNLIDTATLIFVLVYFVITLSDLECDYLNAQQCCSKLNFWLIPKIVAHFLALFMLLIYYYYWLALVNIPIGLWFLYEYFSVPKGNIGVYDPTEIHNRGQLKKHMRDIMIYISYYFILFFVYLYCLIISILKSGPVEKAEPEFAEF